MFHNKTFLHIICAVLFFFNLKPLFSASRNITSLKLDFLRTEKAVEQENSEQTYSSLKGTVIYNKSPYIFIFQITSPVNQTMYVNDDGAFLLDHDSIIEISENADFLNQTCKDFLNWFKSDFGLAETFFAPTDRWLEDDLIVSQWDCFNMQEQPLDKIYVYSDSMGRFTRLKMFVNSSTLVTDTSLSDFKSSGGFSYPTFVHSISYDEAKPIITTELSFSNISFNTPVEEAFITLLEVSGPQKINSASKDLSFAQKIKNPDLPEEKNYRVSIPSVLVSGSFKFYKKFITSQDMSNCPFYPSCSQFMLEAVSQNGFLGFFQGLERLKRCTNTEHSRGIYETLSNGKHYDPVPPKKNKGEKK